MTRLYQSRLKPLGLTYPQYLVLWPLWEKDNVTVSEVGARVHVDSGTLSQLLKRLEASGLGVQRTAIRKATSGRVLITLTEQGQQLKIDAPPRPADIAR